MNYPTRASRLLVLGDAVRRERQEIEARAERQRVVRRQPAPPAPTMKRPKTPPAPKPPVPKPTVEPGGMVLSASEVTLLDHLLATHPNREDWTTR
ncbi:hypothetical protein ABE437_18815 [Isoptericola cucumis]|uniref:hypothetical protein n=1 Tax=Isoptericola cucumis TaxID=1776856 RepID=UPI00320B4D1A